MYIYIHTHTYFVPYDFHVKMIRIFSAHLCYFWIRRRVLPLNPLILRILFLSPHTPLSTFFFFHFCIFLDFKNAKIANLPFDYMSCGKKARKNEEGCRLYPLHTFYKGMNSGVKLKLKSIKNNSYTSVYTSIIN